MAAPPQTAPVPHQILHASCVAAGQRAVLITGAAGSGKSGLALMLMAFGATLVSDDRTVLHRDGGDYGGDLLASAPPSIAGLIEARGVGILKAAAQTVVPVRLVIDLDRTETKRLPEPRDTVLMGASLPLLHKVNSPHFAPAILQYLKVDQEPVE